MMPTVHNNWERMSLRSFTLRKLLKDTSLSRNIEQRLSVRVSYPI